MKQSYHTDTHKHIYPRTYDLPQFFGIVENQIYRSFPPACVLIRRRSETLQPIHYPYIQALELTTILVLSPEKPSRALKSFAEENAIKLVRKTDVWDRELIVDPPWSSGMETRSCLVRYGRRINPGLVADFIES